MSNRFKREDKFKPKPNDALIVKDHPLLLRLGRAIAVGKVIGYRRKTKEIIAELDDIQGQQVISLAHGTIRIRRKRG